MTRSEDCSDIPGTYLFDKWACVKGYNLNMFCMSLIKEENRRRFLENSAGYLDQYSLTSSQTRAILDRNWLKIIQEGGNVHFVAKLGATCGFSCEEMAASMSGMTKEDYRKMMQAGGRPIEGNRSKAVQDILVEREHA